MSESDEQSPAPEYERFDTQADYQAAIERLLVQEGRELRIFDPDLQSLQLNTAARVAQLEQFLVASRTRRMYIVVHDTDYVTKHCPRMMRLLTTYAHAITVRQTHLEIREVQDAFLVLDALHYVRRPVARFHRGAMGINDENEAQAMRSRFQEIWSASYPAVAPTTVGL